MGWNNEPERILRRGVTGAMMRLDPMGLVGGYQVDGRLGRVYRRVVGRESRCHDASRSASLARTACGSAS
jgi:hypothetical protein